MLSSEPLGYLLTWTTYGTWLPGDQRGWVSKEKGFQPPDERTERRARGLMTETACMLDPQQRQVVEASIRSHCEIRRWFLHAVNCRSNHVHVVVTARSAAPDTVMAQFKAWATRKLKARSASEGPPARSTSEGPSPARSASAETLGARGVSEGGATPGARRNWWTERGSTRVLLNEESLQEAIRYVLEGQ